MSHILHRIKERLTPSEEVVVVQRINECLKTASIFEDIALYALDIGEARQANCSSKSNGSKVVVIIRNGRPITAMLREANQRVSPMSMRVDRVVRMD